LGAILDRIHPFRFGRNTRTRRHSKAATILALPLRQISNHASERGPGDEHRHQLRHYEASLRRTPEAFAVEDIRVDTQLLEQAKAAGYSTKVLFISTEDANLNVGRVLVRMSRGGQAVPVSSVIDSYRESTKNLSEVAKYADELLVYDNTGHRHGFRVVAHFIGGKLGKVAQTIPDWAVKVFGKQLHAVKQHGKPRRGR
jgi:hypothetical protein